MVLRIKIIHPNAKPPQRRTPDAAGYDLFTPIDVHIPAKEKIVVTLGLAIQIPKDLSGIIKSHSEHALNLDVEASNAGVIDADHRGVVVGVILRNLGNEPVSFAAGDSIAQLLLIPVISTNVIIVDSPPATERGDGGFSSTDQKKEEAKPSSRDMSPTRKSLHMNKFLPS